ncbi:MAG: NAD-glutamate dehydrogenase [Candidatus Puniceispirillum sp.]|nr:NAD-glutamate dehydrogenase [Candidatus Puniceispirillum sp.]
MTPHDEDDIVQHVTSILKRRIDTSAHASLKRFIMSFYGYQHLKALKRLSPERIADGIERLWNFIQVREASSPKYEVFFWKPETLEASPDRLVIQIVNENMPFLVGSLIHLLSRLELKPRFVIHPVLFTQRDAAGRLVSLSDKNTTHHANHSEESLIYCEVLENVTPESVERVLSELPQMLLEIRQATQDWGAMQKCIGTALEDMDASAYPGEQTRIMEVKEFLNWIQDEHFTFLGYCRYELYGEDGRLLREPKASNPLGILRAEDQRRLNHVFEGVNYSQTARHLILKPSPLIINKTTQVSRVHRSVPMDVIGVRYLNEKGDVIGLHMFLGLFTSVAYDSSARDIPYLRRKVEQVVTSAGLEPTWHDGKALIHVLDSLPRDELFQASVSELTEIGMAIVRLQVEQRVALFMRPDLFKRFMSCLVYVPGDVFDSALMDKIGEVLEREIDGTVSLVKAQFGAFSFARIHYTIVAKKSLDDSYDHAHIEQLLAEVARSWSDDLRTALLNKYSEWKTARLFRLYKSAFSRGYQDRFTGEEVMNDIDALEPLYTSKTFASRVYQPQNSNPTHIKLKFFHYGSPIALSSILPTLENMNLKVISEVPFKIQRAETDDLIWIHDFDMTLRDEIAIAPETSFDNFIKAFEAVYTKQTEDDGFNRLVLAAGLTWRQCSLVRAYARYLKQLGLNLSEAFIQSALVKNAHITALLVSLFEARFHPDITQFDASLVDDINKALDAVDNPDEDRVLRRYLNAILSTLRTNYFQLDQDSHQKSYMSFKFDCASLLDMPLPRPLYEIYIYAQDMEAVHLRGGRVARGGIRWSDRYEDYRTEILGLMKAQMVKNSVIVPVGSKGGFIVKKSLENLSREEAQSIVVTCYQTMIRGMLDITDNLVSHQIVPPSQVMRYDGDDPYLVVAADKGTATFSDYANSVSNAYGFWLGDAFASGGSAGYDHKKMAITARGAWKSVERHFREIGLDIQTTDFTVVGIGDMSGDVFGNGMLLSRHIRLVAAFNHSHIFIDPHPDTKKSFEERERLFNLPRSSWADYNLDTLSQGGAIYERRAKNITLTPEIKEMLALAKDTIAPNDLIKTLLAYHADLLWFGGIGTYVKSSQESNADVGDRNNDAVRVNAKDLTCKVVGEGANLGVTHLGRIEFARRARGHINTDAIDNSAGVDCSDHEVNIKILLGRPMKEGRLSLPERNTLLESMTDNVATLVLQDNYQQNLCLSIMESQSVDALDQQIRLIKKLESTGLLNRAIEYLPEDTTLAEMLSSGKSLVRPELAILLAYAKIFLYTEVVKSEVVKDPFFEGHLISYFPAQMRANWADDALKHPLRDEIIATVMINEIINRTGAAFIHELQETTSRPISHIIKAYYVAVEVFHIHAFWDALETYDSKIDAGRQIKAYKEILKIIKGLIGWLLRHYPLDDSISDLINSLSPGVDALIHDIMDCLDADGEDKLAQIIVSYQEIGFDHDFSEKCAILNLAANSPDIVLMAARTGFSIRQVATLYFLLGSRFNFLRLRKQIRSMSGSNHWANVQLAGMLEDLYTHQSTLTDKLLALAKDRDDPFTDSGIHLILDWDLAHASTVAKLDRLFEEINISRCTDLPTLTVLTRELRLLSES